LIAFFVVWFVGGWYSPPRIFALFSLQRHNQPDDSQIDSSLGKLEMAGQQDPRILIRLYRRFASAR
jgi:hypothetical protein